MPGLSGGDQFESTARRGPVLERGHHEFRVRNTSSRDVDERNTGIEGRDVEPEGDKSRRGLTRAASDFEDEVARRERGDFGYVHEQRVGIAASPRVIERRDLIESPPAFHGRRPFLMSAVITTTSFGLRTKYNMVRRDKRNLIDAVTFFSRVPWDRAVMEMKNVFHDR
jgi:hypothetical protein